MVIQFESDDKQSNTIVKCNNQIIMQSKEGLWVTERNPKSPWIWKKLQSPNIHQVFEVSFNFFIYTFSEKITSSHNEITSN